MREGENGEDTSRHGCGEATERDLCNFVLRAGGCDRRGKGAGARDGLGTAMNIQLGIDVFEVPLNGAHTHDEFLRDLLV